MAREREDAERENVLVFLHGLVAMARELGSDSYPRGWREILREEDEAKNVTRWTLKEAGAQSVDVWGLHSHP